MYATYTLTKDELNLDFIEGIKKLSGGSKMHITIENYDETEYLMKSPKNHEMLLRSIKNAQNRENLIEIPIEEIEKNSNEV